MAYVNVGIVALDDYSDSLLPSLPAQLSQTPTQIGETSGIRSPIPRLSIFWMGQVAFKLGIVDPLNQIRFVYAILGLLSILSIFAAGRIFEVLERRSQQIIVAGLIGFHFVMPFLSTKALIESMAAPFLMMSCFFLSRYWIEKNPHPARDLGGAIVFLALSSLFRFQSGVCGLAFIVVIALKNRWKDLGWVAFFGAICLVSTGLIDLFFGKSFHGSLKAYVKYNLEFSHTYGVSPWYDYVLLFSGLLFFPLWLDRFKGFRAKTQFGPLLPAFVYFFIFVGAHSLVGHKEPRFMATVVPLALLLLTPLIGYFIEKKSYVRLGTLALLNFILLILSSFPIAQNNTVGISMFLGSNSKVTTVYNLRESAVIIPETHRLSRPSIVNCDESQIDLHKMDECQAVAIVREDLVGPLQNSLKPFKEINRFNPGPLEDLMVYLLPEKNARRDSLVVYSGASCSFL